MCTCYIGDDGELVVCDHCASQQIEARNALEPGQVVLETGILTTEERVELTSAFTDFFTELQLSVAGGPQ